MEKVLKRVFERKLKILQRLIRIDDVGSDVIFKRRRRKESITPLCILYYLYNIGSNMGSSISIVGSCALYALLFLIPEMIKYKVTDIRNTHTSVTVKFSVPCIKV